MPFYVGVICGLSVSVSVGKVETELWRILVLRMSSGYYITRALLL
jgi:hypothetical protein